jgi:hypothetical protein
MRGGRFDCALRAALVDEQRKDGTMRAFIASRGANDYAKPPPPPPEPPPPPPPPPGRWSPRFSSACGKA